MVSLSIEQGQGGYFFDRQESVPGSGNNFNINDNDLSHEVQSIHADLVSGPKFRRLSTDWVAVLLIILFIGYAITIFILKRGTLDLGDRFPPFGFFLILHVSLWLIVFIVDRYLQHAHHVSQGVGYLQMFRDTKQIRRLPYNVLSLGNAVLLVIVAVLGHKYQWPGLNLIKILQIIFILEAVICLPGIVWYLVKVIKFNKAQAQPDAADTDILDGLNASGFSHSITEAGFRDGEYVDEVLEKQADMIRYLQQHNANLGRRLMQLIQQQQLNGRVSGSHETHSQM